MMRSIESIDQTKLKVKKPIFVTLTYPNDAPNEEKAERDRSTFEKRLRREHPQAFWHWRKELQERGAVHIHLLVWNVYWIKMDWLARTWFEVVGSEDPKHLEAGTSLERPRTWKGVRWYVSKYMAKEQPNMGIHMLFGRVWGVTNRAAYKECVTEVLAELSSAIFYKLRRTLARCVNAQYRRRGGRFRLKSPYPPGGIGTFLSPDLALRLLASYA
jgi:hypothetical protein